MKCIDTYMYILIRFWQKLLRKMYQDVASGKYLSVWRVEKSIYCTLYVKGNFPTLQLASKIKLSKYVCTNNYITIRTPKVFIILYKKKNLEITVKFHKINTLFLIKILFCFSYSKKNAILTSYKNK